ncbi:MAG: peptidoglycan-binding protein [Myxococcaceae bacterium]|nr:peptidoglycan-binding protein [Myxococcaceae bacterium]
MVISQVSQTRWDRTGSRGPEVSELQQKLADAGFDPGPVDGQFGPMTRAAVRAFQEANGLTVDGIVGPLTWAALDGAGAPEASAAPEAPAPLESTAAVEAGPLSQGAQGPEVESLQRALAGAGFDPGPIDGDFGPMTRGAVVRFQRASGLEADGVAGPETMAALSGSSFVAAAKPVSVRPSADADFRARILEVAQGEVGTTEATNNNDGDVRKYPSAFGRGQEAYCADFVSWVINQSGGAMNDGWCPSIVNKLVRSGDWKGKTNPQAGDIVLFDWDHDGQADHVGFVKSVNANGTLTTLEGNTSGPGGQQGVWEKTRGYDTVLGFGNPS